MKSKALVCLMVLMGLRVQAQMMMGMGMGSGMPGMGGGMMGMQTCMPGGGQMASGFGLGGPGGGSGSEEQKELAEAQKQLRAKEQALKKIQKELAQVKEKVFQAIETEFAETLFDHLDSRKACEEYKVDEINCREDSCIRPYKRDEWNAVCAAGNGKLQVRAACQLPRSRAQDQGRADQTSCAEALTKYSRLGVEERKLNREVERLKSEVDSKKNAVADARATEGIFCAKCEAGQRQRDQGQRSGTDWAGAISGLTTGALAMYMGYQNNKMVAQYNSAIGAQTTMNPSWMYGLPSFASGLNSLMGGSSCDMNGMNGMNAMYGGMNGMNGMNGLYGMNGFYGSGMAGYGATSGYGIPPGLLYNRGTTAYGSYGSYGTYGYGMPPGLSSSSVLTNPYTAVSYSR